MVVETIHGNYLRDVLLSPQLCLAAKSYSKEGTKCRAVSLSFVMQIANDTGELSCILLLLNVQVYNPVLCCEMIHVSTRTGDQQRTLCCDPLFFPLFQAVSPLKCRYWSASVQRSTEVPCYGCQQRLCTVHCSMTAAKPGLCGRALFSKWILWLWILKLPLFLIFFLISEKVHSNRSSNNNPVYCILPFYSILLEFHLHVVGGIVFLGIFLCFFCFGYFFIYFSIVCLFVFF